MAIPRFNPKRRFQPNPNYRYKVQPFARVGETPDDRFSRLTEENKNLREELKDLWDLCEFMYENFPSEDEYSSQWKLVEEEYSRLWHHQKMMEVRND